MLGGIRERIQNYAFELQVIDYAQCIERGGGGFTQISDPRIAEAVNLMLRLRATY